MNKIKPSKYSEAGVDIDKGNAFIEEIRDIVSSTHQRGVLGGLGGFSSHFAIDTNKYKKPVIVTSTDGVGTKLAVAHLCNKHDTIGIDLVAMCVNDLVVGGATPLCFLDYFAVGKLDLDIAKQIITGIAEGCKQANCSLVGGETAEMPGLYQGEDYDLAGFVTGIVDRDAIIDGSDIRAGDKIIGLASSGLHSNGYSLVRKICFDVLKLTIETHIPEFGRTLGEELLTPPKIYSETIQNIIRDLPVLGLAHITGGGIADNLLRIIPKGCKVLIRKDSWEVPPVFHFLQKAGNVTTPEMLRTFNNGIGLIAVVPEKHAQDIFERLNGMNERAFFIGEIVERKNSRNRLSWV